MRQNNYENMITWLHLSDFHVGKDNYRERKLFKEILKHIQEQISNDFIPDIIFITGDLANNGGKSQYEEFTTEFLKPLYNFFDKTKPPLTFIVPGNHDVMRDENIHINRVSPYYGKSKFFRPTIDGLKERKPFIGRFQTYIENDSLMPINWINTPEGAYSTRVEIKGNRIGVVCINTAWLSMNDNDKGKLSPGIDILEDAFDDLDDCAVKIVLGHHPIEWFRSEQIERIQKILGRHNTLYIHGHLHNARVNPLGDEFLCIQCGAAFDVRRNEIWNNGLLWAKLDLAHYKLHLQPRQWNRVNHDWPVVQDLPTKYQNGKWWIYPLPRPMNYIEMSALYEGIRPKHVEHAWFAGRRREIREFINFLKNDELILYYFGESGVGKSWLLNQLLKELSRRRRGQKYQVAFIDFREINSDQFQFMNAIAQGIGGVRLPNYVSLKNTFFKNLAVGPLPLQWVDDLSDSLFHDLKNISLTDQIVLIIDSFEKVQGTTLGNKILNNIKNYFGDHTENRVKTVIGSQKPPETDQLPGVQIEITSFSRAELEEFAEKNLGISENAIIDSLSAEWKADPLVLGQLEGKYQKKQEAASADHLLQLRGLLRECIAVSDNKFFDRLSERIGEESIIKELSVCSVPWWFNAAVLKAMIGREDYSGYSDVVKLSKVPYVKARITGDGYIIHERCRRALLRHLIRDDETMFVEWSKQCYKYLQNSYVNDGISDDIRSEFESIYHLMAFNQPNALVQYNNLRYIFSRLNRVDLMEGLQVAIEATLEINPKITPLCQNWIQYGRAAIHNQTKQHDLALEIYNRLIDQPLDFFLLARINRAKGDILFWRRGKDDIASAKKSYLKAVSIWTSLLKKNVVSPGVNKDDTPKSLAETYVQLARVEEIQGSLVKGMLHFHHALETYQCCEEVGPSYGETLRMMGRNLRLQGKWKEAHLRFNEAEKAQKDLLRKLSFKGTPISLGMRREEIKELIQNVRNARAALWKEEGKWREAKISLRKTINFHKNIPEKFRNREALGIALIDYGDVLRLEGNFLKAKKVYAHAQENLTESKINQGYPLLGLAEIAIFEGMKEKAFNYLTDAMEAFSVFGYNRKLLEVALCQAKLDRNLDLVKAIKNLEETFSGFRSTDNAYVRSAILVELTEMIYDADGDTQRYRDYHRKDITLASQEQGMFNDHLSRLHFLGGCIAGKENPIHAIPQFVVALSCAVRHNKLTLNRILSQEISWFCSPSMSGTEPITRKVDKNNIESKALFRRYEKEAMVDLTEASRIAFKGAVGDLKRSLMSIF